MKAARAVRIGLRADWRQSTLLVAIHAFVGTRGRRPSWGTIPTPGCSGGETSRDEVASGSDRAEADQQRRDRDPAAEMKKPTSLWGSLIHPALDRAATITRTGQNRLGLGRGTEYEDRGTASDSIECIPEVHEPPSDSRHPPRFGVA